MFVMYSLVICNLAFSKRSGCQTGQERRWKIYNKIKATKNLKQLSEKQHPNNFWIHEKKQINTIMKEKINNSQT